MNTLSHQPTPLSIGNLFKPRSSYNKFISTKHRVQTTTQLNCTDGAIHTWTTRLHSSLDKSRLLPAKKDRDQQTRCKDEQRVQLCLGRLPTPAPACYSFISVIRSRSRYLSLFSFWLVISQLEGVCYSFHSKPVAHNVL